MSSFFALMARMKYIERWGLMRSTQKENIQEHSLQTAMIAHALAVIGNELFGKNYNAEHIALQAMYHEASEIITGDLPTPIKYYNSEINTAYKEIEALATDKIKKLLPKELQNAYDDILEAENPEERAIVKYADRICAYLKCIEEVNAGNREFADARNSIKKTLSEAQAPEVQYFLTEFVPAFEMTLDKLEISEG